MNTLELPLVEGSRLTATVEAPELAKELEVGAQPPPRSLVMKVILPKYGDKRFVWNPLNIQEIHEAEKFFRECLAKGLIPFVVGPGGESAEPMPEFEPGAGAVVFKKIADANKTIAITPLKQVRGG